MTNRDPEKHTYSIVPIIMGAHRYKRRVIVGNYRREATGERRAFEAASKMLNEMEHVQRVHVYHTHPSPGPVDRYIGQVHRDDKQIRRAA
jgi:hypothetical protein